MSIKQITAFFFPTSQHLKSNKFDILLHTGQNPAPRVSPEFAYYDFYFTDSPCHLRNNSILEKKRDPTVYFGSEKNYYL